jgi:hypothetical protein
MRRLDGPGPHDCRISGILERQPMPSRPEYPAQYEMMDVFGQIPMERTDSSDVFVF